MGTLLKPTRRIVTAINAEGRSYIAEDGESPATVIGEHWKGCRNSNIWHTFGGGKVDAPDTIVEHQGVLPPSGGTVLRVIDLPPEPKDPEVLEAIMKATFKQFYDDAGHHPDDRHAGMHITDTIDYAIVLQGQVVAVMEEGEAVMEAGDILVQRGTNHSWVNRSDEIARIAFVLIDAQR